MQKIRVVCLTACLTIIPFYQAYGDPTIINNNVAAPAPQQPASPPCGSNPGPSGGLPPGTYTMQNSNGTTSQVYTTGDKQPYIVDNNCNNNMQAPVIQPYINGPGYGPGPGPRPR